MNVLHILSNSDSYDAIATALDLSGCLLHSDCNFIIASSLGPQILESRKPGIKYYRLPQFEINIKNFFLAYRRLKEIIRNNKIDIVHTNSTLSSWLAFFACRNTDRPLIISCYDFFPRNIFNYVLFLAKKVIVHNESVAKYLINNFGLPRERIKFIRQGIDVKNFNFQGVDQRSKTDFNIGIIPSSLPSNGYEYFLKAMVKAVRILPYTKIWIIFSTFQFRQSLREDLKLWVRRLGLINYVKFFDISDLDFKIISKLNLLITTPVTENASTRVVLEAQAYGVPVIATHIAGVADVILDKRTGMLVSPKDNNALVSATVTILKDFQLSRKIADTARKRVVEEFNLDKNIDELIQIYKEQRDNKKILLISVANTQDVISSIPVLRLLRKEFSHTQITILVTSFSRSLFQRCPYVDELIIYDLISKHRGLFGFMGISKLLRKEKFDIVIDLNNGLKTHLLSYLSLANNRYGYSNRFFKFLINHRIKRSSKSLGLVEEKLALLSLLGIDVKDNRLELWPSQEEMEFADSFLKDSWIGKEKIVGIDTSFKKGFFKGIRALDYLAYFCNSLTNQNIRIILIGLRDNLNIRNELLKRTNFKPNSIVGDISPMQLACLIKKCNIYISSNQESLYIAMAMKTPSIVLSMTKNVFDFNAYKDVEVLTAQDFNLNAKRSKGRRFTEAQSSDRVIETVNRLMNLR